MNPINHATLQYAQALIGKTTSASDPRSYDLAAALIDAVEKIGEAKRELSDAKLALEEEQRNHDTTGGVSELRRLRIEDLERELPKSGSEIGALLRDCRDALIDNDWDRIAVRHLIARLEAAIQAPPDSGTSERVLRDYATARALVGGKVSFSPGEWTSLKEEIRAMACRVWISEGPERGHSDIARKLLDPNLVHVNMLRGIIAPITMRQCAHVHGEAMVTWLNQVEATNPPPTRSTETECGDAARGFVPPAASIGPYREGCYMTTCKSNGACFFKGHCAVDTEQSRGGHSE